VAYDDAEGAGVTRHRRVSCAAGEVQTDICVDDSFEVCSLPPLFMSCLSRIGCLTVLVVGGAGAWWLYGGSMPASLGKIVSAPNTPTAVAPPSKRAIAWASLRDEVGSTSDVLGKLSQKSGPAYVTLTAPEVAAVLSNSLGGILPSAISTAQVAIDDDVLRVRAPAPRKALGTNIIPGLVGGLLGDRDTVEVGGSLEVVRPGVGQFRVREMRVRSIQIPPRLIPPLMRSLRSKTMDSDSLADDAVGVPLPKSIADVRVSRGRLTLYKSVSKP
jgi:hypothetical protein